MNCYFQPVNLKHWNIFEKVKNIGHIEVFLATKEMQIGDIMLLHIGNQVKKYEAGVYAWGVIVTRPYVLKDKPQDYCNNRLSVDVKILGIDCEKPFIKTSEHKIFKQYRTVHKLQDETFKLVKDADNADKYIKFKRKFVRGGENSRMKNELESSDIKKKHLKTLSI